MKRLFTLAAALMFGATAMAQDLPQPSPAASFTQRVGLTDITVEYSRPGVKDRTIFGDLVPYGEMWRTGANKATKFTTSTDVEIAGQMLKAGTYSLFTIPGETEWMIIFNKNTELWGTGGYTQREDALRVRVEPKEGAFTESFSISIQDLAKNSANLVLAWDKTIVSIPMKVEVDKMSEANIQKSLGNAANAFRSAATFYSEKGEYDKALGYIDQSIAMNDYWYTNWMKAEILAAKGDKKAAKKQGELAIEKGQAHFDKQGQEFTYREGLEKTMKSW